MDSSAIEEFVKVAIRIKPPLVNNSESTSSIEILHQNPPVILLYEIFGCRYLIALLKGVYRFQILHIVDRQQFYNFDNIFTKESNQQEVYDETVKPLVNCVKMGYNCTIFAYGQTGTGKTYTIGSNPLVSIFNKNNLPMKQLNY